MRKITLAALMLIIVCFLYAEEGEVYHGKSKVNLKENGTILYEGTIEGVPFKVRKFEISSFNYYTKDDIPVYDDFIKKNIIATIHYSNRKYEDRKYEELYMIDIHEICIIECSEDGRDVQDIWAKISYDMTTGWIYICGGSDPYWLGSLELLGSIKTGAKTLTIRKYDYDFSLKLYGDTKLNVLDKPGSDGNIISTLEADNGSFNLKAMAIAEDEEDYYSGFYVKIEYKPGKFGWITLKNKIFEDEYSPMRDTILNTPEWEFFYWVNSFLFSDI